MQFCDGGGGGKVTGIYVALPMGTYYDTAFSVGVASGEDGVGLVGVDFCEDEGGAPAADGVSGRVGAVVGEFFVIPWGEGGFMEAGKGALAHIMGFGTYADEVGGGYGLLEEGVGFGKVVGGDCHAEGNAEDTAEVVCRPVGIFPGYLGALGVEALLFAPEVLRYVVGKGWTECVGRNGEEA